MTREWKSVEMSEIASIAKTEPDRKVRFKIEAGVLMRGATRIRLAREGIEYNEHKAFFESLFVCTTTAVKAYRFKNLIDGIMGT